MSPFSRQTACSNLSKWTAVGPLDFAEIQIAFNPCSFCKLWTMFFITCWPKYWHCKKNHNMFIQPAREAFWAKYRHFWPILSNAWPKNNADKLSRWFSVMLVPKLLLTPIKIRIFGPKTAIFGPKFAVLVILGQILPYFAHFVQCPTKNQCEQGA